MVYTKKNKNTASKRSFKNNSSSSSFGNCKRKNNNRSIKSKSARSLTGGFSSNVLMNNNLFVRNPNLHNTNPQASLDLDKQFMSSSGISASGSNNLYSGLQQGGSTCGNKSVDTKMLQSGGGTFKNYLNKLKNKLDMPLRESGMSNNRVKQKAGGFTTDPSEFIAGRPIIKGYDDCCPPALINGSLKFGGPNTSVCGAGASRGGGHHNNSNSNKKQHKNKQHKQQSRQYRQSSRKHKKNSKNSKKQRGGNFSTFSQSKPAEYESAFNGPNSVFTYPDNMSTRVFNERQPDYSVNAI